MKLLLVEDEASLATAIVEALSEDHYVVDVAHDSQEAHDYLEVYPYDLLMLDIGLPDQNGIDLCRDLRSQGHTQPILLLTAHSHSDTKVEGLDAGADDYLVKPFEMAELAARIRALLRRGQIAQQPILTWGDLNLDPSSCQVSFADTPIHLTPKEYTLLELFLRNPQRVFSQSAILEHLWTYEDPPGTDTVRAHIKGLRQKLKASAAPDVIETVYGLGYRLKALPEDSLPASESEPSHPQKQEEAQKSKQLRTAQALTKTWQRYRIQHWQRLDTLEGYIAKLLSSSGHNPELEIARQTAEREAHKLAGSLGTFGLHHGSEYASQIEDQLQKKQLDDSDIKQLSQTIAALKQALEEFETNDSTPSIIATYWKMATSSSFQKTLAEQGFKVKPVNSLDLLTAQESFHSSPVAWVIDLDEISATDSITILGELSQKNSFQNHLPLLILLTEDADLSKRITASRLGKHTLLQKPVATDTILKALKEQLDCTKNITSTLKRRKILVIDDDESILSVLEELLDPWGIDLHSLSDPQDFWEQLNQINPELLILDIELSELTGIELCQVVRNDPDWSWIPVLFLTAHTDLHTVERVFSAGGDDFVSKPIVGPELITRIFNRLERTELLRRVQRENLPKL